MVIELTGFAAGRGHSDPAWLLAPARAATYSAYVTRDVPMALLTSLNLDHPSLKEIPYGVSVIRVGEHFGDDFAAVVAKHNLG